MLVNTKNMLHEAFIGHYAVAQFNLNNLEWIKAALHTAQALSAPLILGVTESACTYMGGLRTVKALTTGLAAYMRIKIPVALHLDHASLPMCLQAVGAGFSSVMFDGSKLPFSENLRICRDLAKICEENDVSLEAELGSPAGEEDGISGSGERAEPEECAELAKTGISSLAASIGNIHGEYPKAWQGLDMQLLERIKKAVNGLPLVLHGGSGIPKDMISKAIKNGICKINVNTECQIAFARAMRKYFAEKKDEDAKAYNLQKIMKAGLSALEDSMREKMHFFGCVGQVQRKNP